MTAETATEFSQMDPPFLEIQRLAGSSRSCLTKPAEAPSRRRCRSNGPDPSANILWLFLRSSALGCMDLSCRRGIAWDWNASNARCAPRHGHPDSGRDPITFSRNSTKNHKNTRRIQPTAGSASWPDQSVKILLLSAYSSSCCTDLHGSKRLSRGEFNREVRGCMSGGLRASPPTGPG